MLRERTETRNPTGIQIPGDREGSQSRQPLRILVADSDPKMEDMVKLRMRTEIQSGDCEFTFARDGEEALRAALENLQSLPPSGRFDIAICDISLPKLEGLSLLDRLAQDAPELKTIVVSAYGDIRNIRAAMNRGAFDFVMKPVDFEDLRRTVRKAQEDSERRKRARGYQERLNNLENELALASGIQKSILPEHLPREPEYEIFGEMLPARNVGGDFYDVFQHVYRDVYQDVYREMQGGSASRNGSANNGPGNTGPGNTGQIGLAVADVSGKGVPAALFMMASRIALKTAATQERRPGRVLQKVNQILNEDNRTSMFVTVLYAVYNPADGAVSYANGGHCNPLIVHPDGSCSELPPTGGTVLALVPGLEYEQRHATVMPGETLLIYSDGVTEAVNGSGAEFGTHGVRNAFRENPPTGAQEAAATLLEAVSKFAGRTPQADDITCLTLYRRDNQRTKRR